MNTGAGRKLTMKKLLSICVAAMFTIISIAKAEDTAVKTRTFLTDNYSTYMDVPPEILWAELKRMYVEGQKFKELGFSVTPLEDDPLAYLGGTRVVKPLENGAGVDERIARFSVIDDENMFLALHAVYNSGCLTSATMGHLAHSLDRRISGSS